MFASALRYASRFSASLRALYAQRLPSYQRADFRVDSSGDPAVVVEQILRLGFFPQGVKAV